MVRIVLRVCNITTKFEDGEYGHPFVNYSLYTRDLSKPHALVHLATDLKSVGASVAVITETHFKQIVPSALTDTRCSGVTQLAGAAAEWRCTCSRLPTAVIRLDTVVSRQPRIRAVMGARLFVAALYHPPRPVYVAADLLSHIDSCVAEVIHDHRLADIVVAGDLNQLCDDDVVERTALTQLVHQPTRGANLLDRVFVSDPQLYNTGRVVSSVVKSDHEAVVVLSSGAAPHCGEGALSTPVPTENTVAERPIVAMPGNH